MAVWTQKKIFLLLTRPLGSKGCQKAHCFTNETVFCAKIVPNNTSKTIIIEEKMSKKFRRQLFQIFFNSWRTKPQLSYLVDPGPSFDTPGTPGGASIVEIQEF